MEMIALIVYLQLDVPYKLRLELKYNLNYLYLVFIIWLFAHFYW